MRHSSSFQHASEHVRRNRKHIININLMHKLHTQTRLRVIVGTLIALFKAIHAALTDYCIYKLTLKYLRTVLRYLCFT